MRTLNVKQEFDSYTFGSPHELILDGVRTGVSWNGNTKKDLLYGDNSGFEQEEEFAFILVSELDYNLTLLKAGLAPDEKVQFYNQILTYLNKFPD